MRSNPDYAHPLLPRPPYLIRHHISINAYRHVNVVSCWLLLSLPPELISWTALIWIVFHFPSHTGHFISPFSIILTFFISTQTFHSIVFISVLLTSVSELRFFSSSACPGTAGWILWAVAEAKCYGLIWMEMCDICTTAIVLLKWKWNKEQCVCADSRQWVF